ncbi:MAG TPA: VIT domain-containing protein [Pyrinomonadaceae bacterium]|nr:VIT domain-containing protein [Pyrinomonadaceae bacterium]
MHRKNFFKVIAISAISLGLILTLATSNNPQLTALAQEGEAPGALQVLDPSGKPKAQCPLKQTTVKAEISGFLSRVVVTQEFDNPFKEKIEAVYTFPLPQNAAIDDMTMLVGNRTVRGKILRREEAEAVYEAAKAGGQVASLLNQERPNIFTQSVANILPGEKVKITISYIETLKYEDGSYEFVFPMVVGPRYNPGSATGGPVSGNGSSEATSRVPDASRITPNPVPAGMRVGHDISLDVTLDAGVAVDSVNSKSHAIDMEQTSPGRANVRLKSGPVIPNKDFVLRYDVAGKTISDALLTHRSNQGGFFTFILQPPERVTVEDVTPKELVFVLDTSGSMSGFPIEKAKETMKLALESLYPADTFNLITFSGDTNVLFPEPVPATPENLEKAQAFLETRAGGGGTEMMKAIKASLDPSDSQGHIRIVCFMTDGYVGNDMEIISEIQKHPNARVFAFGIGQSVNRFLLEKMAENGRGEVEFVALTDDGSAAARRFHQRVRNPLLTDISVEWNGVAVTDVYPQRIPDLFGAKPVVLTGRYTAAGRGTLRLKGKMSGREFVREIAVDFPETMAQHDVLAPLWARSRIDSLMDQDYGGIQRGAMKPELKETITNLGLEYRLMTQFTSFVAVEEMIVTDGGQPRRIDVPVEVPEGVDRSAVFGESERGNRQVANFGFFKNKAVSETVIVAGSVSDRDRRRVSSRGRSGGGGAGGGGVVTGSGVVTGKGAAVQSAQAYPVTLDATVSSEDRAQQSPDAKLHPSLIALVERLRTRQMALASDETKFVRDGKAELQVWLVEKTPAALAQLKALGFEVLLDSKTSKLVIGRLPVEKLKKLAELKFVRYVAPQYSR